MKKIILLLISIFLVLISYSQVLPDSWAGDTGIDTYQEATIVHGGSSSCRIDVNTGTQANCDLTNITSISVVEGNTFTFKFWANTSEFVRITGILDWVGASVQYSNLYVGPNTGGWSEFTFSSTVPSGATAVNLHIRLYDVTGFTAPETQYVDDFTFESPTGTSLTVTNGDMESWPVGTPPVIANIITTPQFPTSSQTVSVSADLTDDGTVSSAALNWGTSAGSLTNSINMTVSGGDTYTTDTDIPADVDGTTIFYEIAVTDDDANTTTSDVQQYLIHDAMMASLPYVNDFTGGFGDLFPANVAGMNIWDASSGYAFANGYGGDNPEEDWLVLPGIDLDSYVFAAMNFDTYWQYGNDDADNYLKLMYSVDYTGEGDPTAATWTEITTWTKPVDATTWTSSGDVDLSSISGTSVHLAFKYYSTTAARAWRVDNISIFENGVGTTTLPYFDAFVADLNDCYIYSVSGDGESWFWSPPGDADCYGNNSGETEEDWLVMQGINFDDYADELLSFRTIYVFAGTDDETDHYLKLFYSSDYTGTGDPTAATWIEMPFTHPTVQNSWASSGIIDVSSLTGTVYFAFVYRYTDNYRYWAVDDFSIYEGMVDVTFQVDMQNESVSGDGVYLVGDFSPDYPDWDLGDLPMDDTDGDFIYTITLTLETNREYQFKYVNGLIWDDAENPPPVCTAEGNSNRVLTTGIVDETLDLVCYGLCTDCTPDYYDVTFRVNMDNEEVSTDVYLAGNFNGWSNELMTNIFGTTWEVTLPLPEAQYMEYKFKNGVDGWESVSGDCTNGSGNREFWSPGENTVLGRVCFGSCVDCDAPALLISEVALPYDDNTVQFIELYNPGTSSIDFDSDIWYLCRQGNGGSNWVDVQLVGSIGPGETYTNGWSEAAFNALYSPLTLDQESNIMYIAGGDDGLFLYYGGDHTTGTLVDAYGVINEDGTGMLWEYLGTKAVRLRWVDTPTPTWVSWEWSIPEIAGSDQTTPGEHKSDVTWQGTTDNMWYLKGDNWSGTYGYIPDASFNVTIPDVANPAYIFGPSECNNLTIQTNAMVGVGTTSFDIYGNLDVNTGGEFTLGADAAQNASVIVHGSASGEANVERVIQGWDDGANNGWHNISSPVNNMVIAASSFDPGANDDLYQWDEASNTWENFKQGHFTMFVNGRGYLNSFEFSDTKNFVGTLNTDDVVITGLTKDVDGFHLLGNPFASSIVWNNWAWTMSGIGSIAQIWNETNNGYSQISAYGTIPSTNGFFVEVSGAPGSITIPKLARRHDIINNYKNAEVIELVETLELQLTNDENSFYDLCRVGFKEDATEAWNMEYDAHKLFGGAASSQLWSVMNGEDFVYNYLPYVYEPYQVQINFRAGVNAMHHINVEGIDSFFGNSEIYLEDMQTQEIIDLTQQQTYSFTATTNDAENRFVLHFFGVNSVDEPIVASNEVHIYSANQTVYVRFNKLSTNNSQLDIFNTIGQLVYSKQIAPQSISSVQLNEKPGIYIVRLRTENGLTTQKVMIK